MTDRPSLADEKKPLKVVKSTGEDGSKCNDQLVTVSAGGSRDESDEVISSTFFQQKIISGVGVIEMKIALKTTNCLAALEINWFVDAADNSERAETEFGILSSHQMTFSHNKHEAAQIKINLTRETWNAIMFHAMLT